MVKDLTLKLGQIFLSFFFSPSLRRHLVDFVGALIHSPLLDLLQCSRLPTGRVVCFLFSVISTFDIIGTKNVPSQSRGWQDLTHLNNSD